MYEGTRKGGENYFAGLPMGAAGGRLTNASDQSTKYRGSPDSDTSFEQRRDAWLQPNTRRLRLEWV